MARTPSPLGVPLHADLILLAQRRRRLVRNAGQATPETRHLPLCSRPAGGHQPLHRRAQPGTQDLRLASEPQSDHRCPKTRVPSVGVNPIAWPCRLSCGYLSVLFACVVPGIENKSDGAAAGAAFADDLGCEGVKQTLRASFAENRSLTRGHRKVGGRQSVERIEPRRRVDAEAVTKESASLRGASSKNVTLKRKRRAAAGSRPSAKFVVQAKG